MSYIYIADLLVHAEVVEVFDGSLRRDLAVQRKLYFTEDRVVLGPREEAGQQIHLHGQPRVEGILA